MLAMLLSFFVLASTTTGTSNALTAIVVACISLFVSCMVCHGEVARLKPHRNYLTLFYLCVAAGGAVGGIFVGIVAPNIFSSYVELPLGFALALSLLLISLFREKTAFFPGATLKNSRIVIGVLSVMAILQFGLDVYNETTSFQLQARNFFGVVRVSEEGEDPDRVRALTHGRITHGNQYVDYDKQLIPLSYYGEGSGYMLAVQNHRSSEGRHVGVVGLGIGTVSAVLTEKDRVRFYEINPQVISFAKDEFYYLDRIPASQQTVLGDARVSLENERNQEFDILLLDAFASDAVPLHLLTKEAFETYLRHLRPDGILVVHVTNRHVDLRPTMWAVAKHFGLQAHVVLNKPKDTPHTMTSVYALLSRKSGFF